MSDDRPAPHEILARGALTGEPIDEFGPVWTSARARIARAHWSATGADPFLNLEVPYAATSSGRLSEDAVDLALAAHRGTGRGDGLRCLELGSGSGLFAKLFLDRLREVAPEVYAQTRYLVTDGSQVMLDDQARHGLFRTHAAQTAFRVMDASRDWTVEGPFDAIFATYVLDSLPFDLLAVRDGRVWRKEVRGVLSGGDVAQAADLRAALASGDDRDLGRFARLGLRIGLQTRHVPVERDALPWGWTLPEDTGGQTLPFVHSWGPLDCLDRCLRALAPAGVAVVSDYGHAEPFQGHDSAEFQSFGASIAAGLNFPQIAAAFQGREDARLFAPAEEAGNIITRVLCRAPAPDIQSAVDDRYGLVRQRARSLPPETAREFMRGRMFETARDLYRKALEIEPRNWSLIEEVAMMFQGGVEENAIAAELCEIGLELNPLAPGLWRVRALALRALGRNDEARAAILRGLDLAPGNPGLRVVKAEFELEDGRFQDALADVAIGLAHDLEADEQEALLGLQTRILAGIAAEQRSLLLAQASQFRPLDSLPEG